MQSSADTTLGDLRHLIFYRTAASDPWMLLAGPVVGAAAFTWLHDTVARNTEYWRALLGAIMLILVLLAPQGLAGYAQLLWARLRPAQAQGEAS